MLSSGDDNASGLSASDLSDVKLCQIEKIATTGTFCQNCSRSSQDLAGYEAAATLPLQVGELLAAGWPMFMA
jgi:hypothetical protein